MQFDYYFEEVQTLTFEIADVDAHSEDYIGSVSCSVGEIFGSRGQELARPIGLQTPKLLGKSPVLYVRAEEVQGQNATVHLRFSADHVDSAPPILRFSCPIACESVEY